MTQEMVSPRPLIELGTGFWASKTLLSAVELGLFTVLASGPATEPELRAALDLHPRSSRDFLDSLVALGVLEREGDRYFNTAAADLYLDERKDGYLGGWMRQASKRLFLAWGGLTESLRTGRQSIGSDTQDYFRKLYADLDHRRSFISAMDAITNHIGPELVDRVDWSRYTSVVDIGGARGNLLTYLVKAHPELRCTVFDMPELRPLFDEHVAAHGTGDRMRFVVGDFFTEPLPEADVLVFGHILHDWDVEERRALIAKAFQAVRPGGAVVFYDRMIDDDRRTNTVGLLGCLNLLLVTPGGSEYTVAECRRWVEEAGFARTVAHPLVDGLETAVVGYKAE
ncbi:8-O-methyltransferase [Saccharothrix tamanrassetensis]|uniref:8-O-methyltransferase n=1 Tax=Saccharothrix tamanrassetensis TaxID=1051531 RepID=A0A841CKI1_9PSEU|nr:methyltransferase [Saccharothrix tamanrassetensis]MBB5957453.1 8-O-methyltransferase [Saccharothrix tamanrassetensis]